MMKTIVLIVVLAGLNPVTGGKDLMLFPQTFESVKSCIEFARENQEPLIKHTWEFYGVRPVENIYCVDEEELGKMNVKPQTKEDITPKEPDDIEEWWRITPPNSNGLST